MAYREFYPPEEDEKRTGDPMGYGRKKSLEYKKMQEYVDAIAKKKYKLETYSTMKDPEKWEEESVFEKLKRQSREAALRPRKKRFLSRKKRKALKKLEKEKYGNRQSVYRPRKR